MPLELERIAAPELAEREPAPLAVVPGAALVHLAETLYVRMFAFACALVVAGCALALWFTTLYHGLPGPATAAFVAATATFAIAGLARPLNVYRRLRSHGALQLSPAALGALAVLIDGPESQCWWVALPLLWVVATLSSTLPTLVAAVVAAAAFVAGTLIGGQALITAGDLGVLPAAVALPAYALVGRVFIDGFAGLVLGRQQLALDLRRDAQPPLRVPNLRTPPATGAPRSVVAAATPARRRRPASRLTARQLEVTLLLRDGLRQTEIAACLAISTRQVERLLAGARERVGAATTTQLVAMLAAGRLSDSVVEVTA